jgi:hypothetical protein
MNREDLKNYIRNKQWVDKQKDKYEELRNEAENLKSVVIDGLPKAKNKTSYHLEQLLDSINELIDIIATEEIKCVNVIKTLNQLNPTSRDILYDIYVQGMSLEETSTDVHYSYYETCRRHGLALNEFDKIQLRNFPQDSTI